jgi:peptide/nickel transport system substrate-binding protein
VISISIAWAAGEARAETRANYGGSVQAALGSAPATLEPLSGEPGDSELTALVYDTLFRADAVGKPRPHLAVGLEDLGTRARLTLRGDVKFHDGTTLTAADVAASLTHALKQPGGWMLAPIVSAHAVSDQMVELQLSRPAPDLPLLLSTPAAMILPGGAPRAKPIGSGPFAVDKIERGTVTLRAFAEHFAGRPYLDHLILRAFASRTEEAGAYEIGALMASRHGVSAFEGGAPRHAGTVTDGPPGVIVFLALGPKLPAELAGPLQAALAAGLDRERLRRLVGAPAVAVASPNLPRTTLDATSRPRLGLCVDASRFEHRALADRLLAELARLGVDASIELVEEPLYHERRESGQYDLLLGEAVPPAPELAELALLAAVDPAAARAQLSRAPAAPGAVKLDGARLVPLIRRGARISHLAELRGVTVDGAARVDWANVHLHTKSRAASE